jgi:phosphoribosylformimino-5-aminoimidazole carboxamide ribotide isomerase
MTIFRPCIDLHSGVVKQIVGSSLRDEGDPTTNFSSEYPAEYFAALYKKYNLIGGHVIKLGSGNDDAVREALAAWCFLLIKGWIIYR